MRVRAVRHGDVRIPGNTGIRAVFAGQEYDLPEDVVREHDWLVPVKAMEPVLDKMEELESDKSLNGPVRRGRRGNA